jgi:hypothetical protein
MLGAGIASTFFAGALLACLQDSGVLQGIGITLVIMSISITGVYAFRRFGS